VKSKRVKSHMFFTYTLTYLHSLAHHIIVRKRAVVDICLSVFDTHTHLFTGESIKNQNKSEANTAQIASCERSFSLRIYSALQLYYLP
jgi:hypothetical protein